MFGSEHLCRPQAPCISSIASTRLQFLDFINSFLENNNVSLIGSFRIEIQEAEAGIDNSGPLLSLKCEIRYISGLACVFLTSNVTRHQE